MTAEKPTPNLDPVETPTSDPPVGYESVSFPDFAPVGPHTVDFRGLSPELRAHVATQLRISFRLSPTARLAMLRVASEEPVPATVMLSCIVGEMTPILENLSVVLLLQRARTMFLDEQASSVPRDLLLRRFADWRAVNPWFDELLWLSSAFRSAIIGEYAGGTDVPDPLDCFAVALAEGRRSVHFPQSKGGAVWSFPEGLRIYQSSTEALEAEARLAKATADEVNSQIQEARSETKQGKSNE